MSPLRPGGASTRGHTLFGQRIARRRHQKAPTNLGELGVGLVRVEADKEVRLQHDLEPLLVQYLAVWLEAESHHAAVVVDRNGR
mgnify:CR=1 FL=1